jgi:hypothetical protein
VAGSVQRFVAIHAIVHDVFGIPRHFPDVRGPISRLIAAGMM